MSEWLAEIVNQILFLGFFLALLKIRSPGVKRSSTAFDRPRVRLAVAVSRRATCLQPV